MPSPSKLSLILALSATAGAFYGGAWFASGLAGDAATQPSPAERKTYVPAPIPEPAERNRSSGIDDGGAKFRVLDIAVEPFDHFSLTGLALSSNDGSLASRVFIISSAKTTADARTRRRSV